MTEEGSPPVRTPQQQQQQVQVGFAGQIWSGPLPHPDEFAKYAQLFPGAAERIFDMAERQAEHRRSIEAQYAKTHNRNDTLGLIAGVLIVFAAIGAGVFLITQGKDTQGLVALFGVMVPVIGVFALRKKQGEP